MEKNQNQKKDNSLIFLCLITLVLFFVLVVFIINNGMNTTQDIGLAGALFFMIIIGLVKITKLRSAKRLGQDSQPAASTPTPPTGSGNTNDTIPINTGTEDPTVSQVSPIVSKPLPGWIQNIRSWLQKFPKPKQIMIVTSSFFVIIIIVIIMFSWGGGGQNTTITGTWKHELGTGDNSWIMTTTMWNVSSYYDSGYLYMDVNEDGTFTLTYNDVPVSQGAWEERNTGYYFLYTDIDGILASVSYEYTIKGSKLIWYSDSYFTKI